jgi:mRNA-degrading endonuclease toxin of MazEF toxin-antitoxin module
MVAKIRPCLVVSIPAKDENDRVLTIPTIKMIRMLGNLTAEEMLEIEAGLKVWLGLTD